MSPVALDNIAKLVEKFGVEHMFFRPESSIMERMYSYAFTHLNEKGCAGTVDQFDGDFFSDAARNVAADLNIPMIFSGLSRTQVERILRLTSFETDASFEASNREEVAGIRLRDIFSEDEMKYWWNGANRSPAERPRMLFPFYVWDLEETFIKQEVIRLGLMPRGDESPLVTNNQLIPLMGIVDVAQFGYCSFEPEFAQMVRHGKADRKEWLYMFEIVEYSGKTGAFINTAIEDVLKRLSLTRSQLKLKG